MKSGWWGWVLLVFLACPTRRRPRGRPWICLRWRSAAFTLWLLEMNTHGKSKMLTISAIFSTNKRLHSGSLTFFSSPCSDAQLELQPVHRRRKAMNHWPVNGWLSWNFAFMLFCHKHQDILRSECVRADTGPQAEGQEVTPSLLWKLCSLRSLGTRSHYFQS